MESINIYISSNINDLYFVPAINTIYFIFFCLNSKYPEAC